MRKGRCRSVSQMVSVQQSHVATQDPRQLVAHLYQLFRVVFRAPQTNEQDTFIEIVGCGNSAVQIIHAGRRQRDTY
jgi:hypothetical protein